MTWTTLRAWLAALIGLAVVAGLLVVGFVALLVLVPVGIVLFLLVRHRAARRMSATGATTWTWSSGGARPAADIEGVVVGVEVAEPGQESDDEGPPRAIEGSRPG